MGPSKLSVFKVEKRTQNDPESFHANLKRKFKSRSPNYWDFIRNLNKVFQITEKDLERIDNNVLFQRRKRKAIIDKEIFIQDIQEQLINGEIN